MAVKEAYESETELDIKLDVAQSRNEPEDEELEAAKKVRTTGSTLEGVHFDASTSQLVAELTLRTLFWAEAFASFNILQLQLLQFSSR